MKYTSLKTIVSAAAAMFSVITASSQAMYFKSASVADSAITVTEPDDPFARPDTIRSIEDIYAFLETTDSLGYDTLKVVKPLPSHFFGPAVYKTFSFGDTISPFTPDYSGYPELRWVEEVQAQNRMMRYLQHRMFSTRPEVVRYNINTLPEAPKQFHAVVNPEDHTIEISELNIEAPKVPTIAAAEVKKRHWIRTFNASLQFSQAYVSPNWYQGGNSNLNMLANIYYNVKLNQEFHPNLLFETTAQYKLGINSAPDDSIHSYNISDDLLQVNSTFGLKAAKRWYYSLTGQFKTQLLNSYPSNSRELRSAFLSPAELTLGVGMTYNYANEKKTFTFDASIAPVSYNLRTCVNHRVDPTLYNIKEGRRTEHNFGSSAELKLMWKITYNIVYTSRVFAFTDYDSFQGDWEHKINFDINRYLTTQIYAHLRYDSSTPPCDDPGWKKLQVKEILSIGFAYKFSTI